MVLHGAGIDHREKQACFEPAFDGVAGLRRIYLDPPGMGRMIAPETLLSADDVLDTLLNFARAASDGDAHLLVGHSPGAYFAQAMAARRPAQIAGLALVRPLLSGLRDVPEQRAVVGSGEIGDDVFRIYFVIQTPQMPERYERYVAPAAALVDQAALERIGEWWALTADRAPICVPIGQQGSGRHIRDAPTRHQMTLCAGVMTAGVALPRGTTAAPGVAGHGPRRSRAARTAPSATYVTLGEDAAKRGGRPGRRLRVCSESRPTPGVKCVHDLFRVVLHGRGRSARAVRWFRVRGRPKTFAAVRANARHRE